MSQPAPTPTPAYYVFPDDFWAKVGYSREALATNRLGRFTEAQGERLTRPELGQIATLAILYAILFAAAFILLTMQGGSIVLALLGFAVATVAGLQLLRRLKVSASDRERGVASLCGEFSEWTYEDSETEDSYGLKAGPFRASLSYEAWYALPDRAHYRIYFTPRLRTVVNVEEHSDDAPHLKRFSVSGLFRPTISEDPAGATYYIDALDAVEAQRYLVRGLWKHYWRLCLSHVPPTLIGGNRHEVRGPFDTSGDTTQAFFTIPADSGGGAAPGSGGLSGRG